MSWVFALAGLVIGGVCALTALAIVLPRKQGLIIGGLFAGTILILWNPFNLQYWIFAFAPLAALTFGWTIGAFGLAVFARRWLRISTVYAASAASVVIAGGLLALTVYLGNDERIVSTASSPNGDYQARVISDFPLFAIEIVTDDGNTHRTAFNRLTLTPNTTFRP